MGKGAARTIKYWLDKGYSGEEAEKMRMSRIPGTLEYFMIYKGMNKVEAEIEYKRYNKKRAITLENLINKYGKIEGTKRWDSYIKKQSYTNTFEYKQKKYGWTEKQFDEYNKSRGVNGEKNGNYGSSYYQVWVEKYGKEKADDMNAAMSSLKAKGGKSQKGIPKSIEARKNMSLGAIKRIKEQDTFISYNPSSIPIIENYGKENGYNFQHAENGGEYLVENVWYYVDGYDKEKNVVIEYYEKAHKHKIQKDLDRQLAIMNELKCKFVIIKYDSTIEEYNFEN